MPGRDFNGMESQVDSMNRKKKQILIKWTKTLIWCFRKFSYLCNHKWIHIWVHSSKFPCPEKTIFFQNLPFYGFLFTNFIHKKTCRKCLITIKCLADCIMLSKVNRKHEIEEFEMKKKEVFFIGFLSKIRESTIFINSKSALKIRAYLFRILT